MTHGFGRKPKTPDERDWSLDKLTMALGTSPKGGVPKWIDDEILDQGNTPECVSAGTLGLLNCDDETHTDPHFKSSDIDPFFRTIPGADSSGAEVRNGLKEAKANGLITAYAALGSISEISLWLDKHGPVLVGTDFTADMENPDVSGEVKVTGDVVGGHCWFLNGDDGIYYDAVNSWGTSWGKRGTFYLAKSDFLTLLDGIQNPGEAWAVTEKPLVAPPTPPKPPVPPKPAANVFLRAILKALRAIVKEIDNWLREV